MHDFVVDPADGGQRLDSYLAGRGLPLSRSQLARRIGEGEVEVDGAAGRPSQKLRPGQRVRLRLAPPRDTGDLPEDIPLAVLHEDRHLILVDKPAGMVVHPAPGHERGTLVNALLHHCGALPAPPAYRPGAPDDEDGDDAEPGAGAGLSIGGERRPGIVHRLDQGTSGVLVCAKDEPTLVGLQQQFQAHSIDRRYLALVVGVTQQSGTIRTRYGRHPADRKRFTGRAGARHAVTHYRVVERLPGATLLAVTLETGRTHQIRVHLSEAGFPVLGDPLYGRPGPGRLRELGRALGHQALHAELLGFVHPVTGARVEARSPLPADYVQVLHELRQP